ncbi:22756_t:CDS:2, partial [Rhizophagus irregularis]
MFSKPMIAGLEENKGKNYTLQFFGNDLSVEDFWMVLYFQTLPY